MGISKRREGTPSERTLKMKSWAVCQLKDGNELPTPNELAKKFDLHPKTVRNHLGEIAQEAGLQREDLLEKLSGKHTFTAINREPLIEAMGLEEFHEYYTSMMDDIHNMTETIKTDIQRQESFLNENEGGIL